MEFNYHFTSIGVQKISLFLKEKMLNLPVQQVKFFKIVLSNIQMLARYVKEIGEKLQIVMLSRTELNLLKGQTQVFTRKNVNYYSNLSL